MVIDMKTEQMKTIYHHAMEQLPLDGLEGRTLEKLSSAKDKKRGFPAKRIAARGCRSDAALRHGRFDSIAYHSN